MKRFLVLLLTLSVGFIFATVALAGIWGTVTGFIKAEAVSILIGAGIGALGMLGVSYKLWGVAARELGECIWSIYEATRPDSPGGKSVTKKEMQKIIDNGQDIYPAVVAAIASHKSNS